MRNLFFFLEEFMNKTELLEAACKAEKINFSKAQRDRFLKAILKTITLNVKKGNDVTLTGFGTFTKVKRSARIGRNPSNGAKIKIKAKTVPKFRPGSEFKNSVR
jgi:DNA-binding protein HU-beta